MKKLTLKNLKFVESMSQETPCFSADLYEEGKLIAHVSNRGHGGGNDVRPAEGLTYKDVAHIDNLDTECEIFEMVEELNIVKKHQGKGLVIKDGEEYFTIKYKHSLAQIKKSMGAIEFKRWLDIQVKKQTDKGYKVLNTNLV